MCEVVAGHRQGRLGAAALTVLSPTPLQQAQPHPWKQQDSYCFCPKTSTRTI